MAALNGAWQNNKDLNKSNNEVLGALRKTKAELAGIEDIGRELTQKMEGLEILERSLNVLKSDLAEARASLVDDIVPEVRAFQTESRKELVRSRNRTQFLVPEKTSSEKTRGVTLKTHDGHLIRVSAKDVNIDKPDRIKGVIGLNIWINDAHQGEDDYPIGAVIEKIQDNVRYRFTILWAVDPEGSNDIAGVEMSWAPVTIE